MHSRATLLLGVATVVAISSLLFHGCGGTDLTDPDLRASKTSAQLMITGAGTGGGLVTVPRTGNVSRITCAINAGTWSTRAVPAGVPVEHDAHPHRESQPREHLRRMERRLHRNIADVSLDDESSAHRSSSVRWVDHTHLHHKRRRPWQRERHGHQPVRSSPPQLTVPSPSEHPPRQGAVARTQWCLGHPHGEPASGHTLVGWSTDVAGQVHAPSS